ncbi:MAG: hypothetical protein ACJ8KF_13650 [Chthoniobacterales bacterium]
MALLLRTQVIVDHDPAAVIQQLAIGVQISTYIIVRVENEQAHVAVAQPLTNFGDCCLVEGTPVDQTNVSRYAESREILSQIGRYLDALGGIVTVSVGHCHSDVLEVARRQK